MATYIIGDVQGCFDELMALLDKINFNPEQDQLGFVGDLVNRGPKSLEVLRFVSTLKNPLVVLGNHDLYLLALALTDLDYPAPHTLDAILTAPDKNELINWLRHQPLFIKDAANKLTLSHAGVPPQWSIDETGQYAGEVSQELQGDNHIDFLTHLFGDEPTAWSTQLTDYSRLRYICNALTRMRFCQKDGTLNLKDKNNTSSVLGEKPWFEFSNPDHQGWTICFGHWAALQGQCSTANIYALDEGCAWGNFLCALRVEDLVRFRVPAVTV